MVLTVKVVNTTPHRRGGVVVRSVPLPPGYLLPTDAESALSFRVDGGAWSWCQWWPRTSPGRYAAGDRGWLYPTGHMREVLVAFPLTLEAGLAVGETGRELGTTPECYDYYRAVTVEIDKVTSTPVAFSSGSGTWDHLNQTRFSLVVSNGGGESEIRLNPWLQYELWKSHHGTTNGYVRVFERTARLGAYWHSVLWCMQSWVGGGGQAVPFWHEWGVSDPRVAAHVHAAPRKVYLRVSTASADVGLRHDAIRRPEATPTVYNAAGTSVVTAGSGSSAAQESASSVTVSLWDPGDRDEVAAVGQRRELLEGTSQVTKGVLSYLRVGSTLPALAATTAAADAIADVMAVSQDFPDNGSGTFGLHGYVPAYDERGSHADRDASYIAACRQADAEYSFLGRLGGPHDVRDPVAPPRAAAHGPADAGMYAAAGCPDLRRLEVTCHQLAANCAWGLREVDGSVITPSLHAPNAADVAEFGNQVVPFYRGLPGWAATIPDAIQVGMKSLGQADWGKPRADGVLGPAAIEPSESGAWVSGDRQVGGGLDWGIVTMLAYTQLAGDFWSLRKWDDIRMQPLCGQLTPYTTDAERYYRKAFESRGALPEVATGYESPFALDAELEALLFEYCAACYRATGDSEIATHVDDRLSALSKFAVGSPDRFHTIGDSTRAN